MNSPRTPRTRTDPTYVQSQTTDTRRLHVLFVWSGNNHEFDQEHSLVDNIPEVLFVASHKAHNSFRIPRRCLREAAVFSNAILLGTNAVNNPRHHRMRWTLSANTLNAGSRRRYENGRESLRKSRRNYPTGPPNRRGRMV